MNIAEIHHSIDTRNHKTTEHFGHPQRNPTHMMQIFAFHFDAVETDPKTFLIQPQKGKPKYFTARELQQKRREAQKDCSIQERLFSDIRSTLEHARYAFIIYEPLPSKKPSLFLPDDHRRLGEAR